IEQHMFGGAPKDVVADPHHLDLLECADRRSEVAACARRIRSLARAGHRYRDIAVLVRDLDEYHDLVSAAVAEHGIPFFPDRRPRAAHHPLLQFTRALFQIARTNWSHDAVMTLLKSGLTSLTRDQIDELENYVLLHRIRGGAWSASEDWTYTRTVRT